MADDHRRPQRAFRQASVRIHPSLGTASQHDRLDRIASLDRNVDGRAPIPRPAEHVELTRPLGVGDEWELDGCRVDLAGRRIASCFERGGADSERHDRDRPFVHAVGTDDGRHLGIRETSVERGSVTGGVRDREELREHRAGIPIDVTEPALTVPPAGPPRDPGDDDDGSLAARWRPDPHEGVVFRVIPVHAWRQVGTAVGYRDVQLEWEPPARGAGGAEQPRRALAEFPSLRVTVTHHRAHDAGGQVQQP